MDFMPGVVSYIMSHAAGGVKPWNKKMLWSALQGSLRAAPTRRSGRM